MTSPLTNLGTISTPESYYTARNSPSNAADETALTSPVELPEEDDDPGYRDAVQLPHVLKSHCQIHLEEQLYTAAIHILSGLLSDGSTTSPTSLPSRHSLPPPTPTPFSLQERLYRTPTLSHSQSPFQSNSQKGGAKPKPKAKPALVPPPSQLALLATLTIHPAFTSRAQEQSNLHAAAHAHAYLRGLLGTVGPVNANLRAAFSFGGTGGGGGLRSNGVGKWGWGSGGNWSNGSGSESGSQYSSEEEDHSPIFSGPFAHGQLLFRRSGPGSDFWAVLGWAFRCAAEFPARWRHWRVWLDFMVEVLEKDWDERLGRDEVSGVLTGKGKRNGKSPSRQYPAARGSLVVGYLEDLSRERRNAVREALRALFAFSDGEWAADRAVFREVFERETVVGRGKSKRKRVDAVVDLENDQFGDYLDGDEFDSEEEEEGEGVVMPSALRNRRKAGRKAGGEGSGGFRLTDGITETVPFRLRIFRLLSGVSFYVPDTFAPVDELYERFIDHVRGLPLPMFKHFIDSHPPTLPEALHVTMLRTVIENMLPRHPKPADVDPEGESLGHAVTVLMMEKCFLPFAANKVTAEDNAKLSLALESLLGFVYSQLDVEYSEGLRNAVEKGIRAREDKVKKRSGASRADAADKAAREALARSTRSLRVLLDVIAVTGA